MKTQKQRAIEMILAGVDIEVVLTMYDLSPYELMDYIQSLPEYKGKIFTAEMITEEMHSNLIGTFELNPN